MPKKCLMLEFNVGIPVSFKLIRKAFNSFVIKKKNYPSINSKNNSIHFNLIDLLLYLVEQRNFFQARK
jgi:hypothetical protein